MILPYAKKTYPNMTDEEAIRTYVLSKAMDLESDTYNRVYGTKNKTGTGYRNAGYQILRDFYDGDQWTYTREEGSAMNVINFCRMTVDNFVAFLTQEEPEIDIPPQDPKDDIENARVAEVEKLIREILDENEFYNHWVDAVQNGSLLGDSMIVGPFWDEQNKRIWFSNVKRPEFVRIIWQDENYNVIMGYLYYYYMSLEAAQATYGEQLKAKGIDLKNTTVQQVSPATTTQQPANRTQQLTRIVEFYDDNVRMLLINDKVLEFSEHGNGFVPLMYVKNRPHPTNSWGVSDIEDLLDPQKTYNEQNSDMQDIIKQVAFASIFGKNLDVEEIQSGVAKIYDMGDESEVFSDPRNTNFPFLQSYLSDTKQNVDITAGVPDVFQGGKGAANVSGRALSVLMTPINNKVRGKERRWGVALSKFIKNIEVLLEKKVPGADILIQKWYKVDIFFPGTLVRDVTDELNKFLQKVQSQYTTMKNIGIASPKDEQALMKKELSDVQLAIEISRNPQLQMAVAQQMISQARQNMPGQQPGEAAARNGASPTLSNDQNQGGEVPASARGNAVPTSQSPAGALQTSAQASGPSLIPNA